MGVKLLRRASAANPETDSATEVDGQDIDLDKPQGKGRPTPKRRERERRRGGPPEPPPMTRKEAYKRAKARKQAAGASSTRVSRNEARQRMIAGEEEYLMPRDKGPVRRAVRDIVDARPSVASWFLVVGFIIVLGSYSANPTIRVGATSLWGVLFAALAVDWFFLYRRIKTMIQERFPKDSTPIRSYVFYGIMRSAQFRRMRIPKPQVPPGRLF